MSGIETRDLREKVTKILNDMHGVYRVWSLDITEVRRIDSNFVVVGTFSETMFGQNNRSFTITINPDGNIVEAKIQ